MASPRRQSCMVGGRAGAKAAWAGGGCAPPQPVDGLKRSLAVSLASLSSLVELVVGAEGAADGVVELQLQVADLRRRQPVQKLKSVRLNASH